MSEPSRIGDAVARERDRLWRRGAGLGLQAAWRSVAGEEAAANTRVRDLRDGVMTVSCSTGGWALELRLAADELVAGLNRAGMPETVRELRLMHEAQNRIKYSK
jgi:predicted nucleic acid-binding Zn ribbon protein